MLNFGGVKSHDTFSADPPILWSTKFHQKFSTKLRKRRVRDKSYMIPEKNNKHVGPHLWECSSEKSYSFRRDPDLVAKVII